MSVALTTTDASPRAPRTDTLADTVIFLLALTAVQRLVGFARSVLFCRWLDPLELGEWDLAFGFLLLAAPLTLLGLPGSFGRYVEFYRQRGQLRSFLSKATLISALLATCGVSVVAMNSGWFSHLVFGRPDRIELVRLLAAGLCVVIVYNFLMELFTALRMFRVVSGLQFAHSLAFAVVGGGLLFGWQSSAASVVLAYSAACLLCMSAAIFWLRRMWHALPRAAAPLSHRELLVKLMPFAVWMWVTNWLSNLFDVADRYMLIHYSGLDSATALAQVGNYHSSRVVPILLVSIAAMLANATLPHMSHDWETGRRTAVSQRVNLMLKLMGFASLLGASIILLAAPILFDYAFQGKYSGGLAVLPWTLVYCVWFGLVGLAQNYLWCAEKAGLGSLAVLAGVLVNIGLNLVLLPRYGLHGAVLATVAANFVAFTLTCLLAHLCGLRFDSGMWIIALLPPLLALGPGPMLAVLCVLAAWAACGNGLLSGEDRRQLSNVWRDYTARWREKPVVEGA